MRRLVVAGGETSGAVVDRLGIPVFWSVRKSLPVCRCCAQSAMKNGEMMLALKSGNFGGPEFFSDALKLMR